MTDCVSTVKLLNFWKAENFKYLKLEMKGHTIGYVCVEKMQIYGMINNKDLIQTVPLRTVCSGTTLLVQTYMPSVGYRKVPKFPEAKKL